MITPDHSGILIPMSCTHPSVYDWNDFGYSPNCTRGGAWIRDPLPTTHRQRITPSDDIRAGKYLADVDHWMWMIKNRCQDGDAELDNTYYRIHRHLGDGTKSVWESRRLSEKELQDYRQKMNAQRFVRKYDGYDWRP